MIASYLCLSCKTPTERTFVYKTSNGRSLKMLEISTGDNDALQCGIVFFHGGGFIKGNPSQFRNQATYLASKGAKCYLVQYSLQTSDQFNPIESLIDAKEAIQYLRRNSQVLNLDKNKIVAIGGSAGGYLAIGSSMLSAYDNQLNDKATSSGPNAIILFNPLINTGPKTYASNFFDNKFELHSPFHNVNKGSPPVLIMTGTEDQLIKIEEVRQFTQKMESVGNSIELIEYEGKKHGFFNNPNSESYKSTIKTIYEFLLDLEFLPSKN
ncbi:alpha/beta hydrolase [Ekhidna sp.]